MSIAETPNVPKSPVLIPRPTTPEASGWEVYLLVVIKSPYATVNGSNSAGKLTIEVPHDESVSIGCSAYYIVLVLDGFEGGPYKALHEVQLFGGLPTYVLVVGG